MPATLFSENPFALWAKLPHGEKSPESFHPLLCHMIDVAVVAGAMWREVLSATARKNLAATLRLSEAQAERWILYLAALHDLGKASPAFQLREESIHLASLYSSLGTAPRGIKASDCPHGRVTAKELPDLLRMNKALAERLSVAIGGHHGLFPTSDDLMRRCPTDGVGRGGWKAVRKEIAACLADLLGISPDTSPQQVDHPTLMFIAGLVSVADWIGSNDEFFRYFVSDWRNIPRTNPREYLERAETQAVSALNRLGWTGWTQSPQSLSFTQLFPFPPRPLQETAINIAEKMNGIGIVIVEAPMGEGKTEAALYLADRWGIATEAPDDVSPGDRAGVRGCYVALPTQATSNQMFRRVRQFLAQRYPGNVVNLQLLHGHAALSAEFQTMKANGDKVFKVDGVYSDGECAPQAMSVVAAEWFTHRKRGLLAPFGVGTVDQALMAVLQTKHVFVRLFGLAHKTVIIDEVHAYDAYMSKLLERLLEWLAALGSPVVLLSATLPGERRKALLEAYQRGLSGHAKQATIAPVKPAKYPRITWATKAESGEQHIEASADLSRTLQLKWVNGSVPELPGESCALGEQLKAALADGGCAAVICNTVNRAQQVFRALQPYFAEDELDLFHARFLFTHRDHREKRALARFGKEGDEIEIEDGHMQKVARPHRYVLVATQVIEQSLDLDFDLMVTDIAPVDLVLQRSGRLHRHSRTRPAGLSQPVLWISEPENICSGVPAFDDGTKAVYDAHILLRSWLTLHEKSAVGIPDEIEDLIERVYGQRECPTSAGEELQAYWQQTAKELSDELKKMQASANDVIIPPPYYPDDILEKWNKRLEEDRPDIHKSLQALTRLTEPTVSVVILRAAEQRQIDLTQPPAYEAVCFLLHHSVNLSHRGLVWNLLSSKVPDAWQRSALLRHHRLIELDADGNWSDGKYQLRLDEKLGVVITKLKGAGNA